MRRALASLAASLLVAVAVIGHEAGAATADLPALRLERDQAAHLAATLRAQWALHPTPHATTEPAITAGRIVKPSIDVARAPGVPELAVTLSPGTVGALYVSAAMVSPSGAHGAVSSLYLPLYPARTKSGTVSFLVLPASPNGGFGLYAEPGAWTLSSLTLISQDGTLIVYQADQLARLFPSLSVDVVNRGTPDTTAPTAGAGAILTRSVSLGGASPFFAVKLAVADDISGVASVLVGFAGPPGSNTYQGAQTALTLPVARGNVTAYVRLPPDTVTGDYTITSMAVCDVAGNCLTQTSPESMQATFGGTSFKVTP